MPPDPTSRPTLADIQLQPRRRLRDGTATSTSSRRSSSASTSLTSISSSSRRDRLTDTNGTRGTDISVIDSGTGRGRGRGVGRERGRGSPGEKRSRSASTFSTATSASFASSDSRGRTGRGGGGSGGSRLGSTSARAVSPGLEIVTRDPVAQRHSRAPTTRGDHQPATATATVDLTGSTSTTSYSIGGLSGHIIPSNHRGSTDHIDTPPIRSNPHQLGSTITSTNSLPEIETAPSRISSSSNDLEQHDLTDNMARIIKHRRLAYGHPPEALDSPRRKAFMAEQVRAADAGGSVQTDNGDRDQLHGDVRPESPLTEEEENDDDESSGSDFKPELTPEVEHEEESSVGNRKRTATARPIAEQPSHAGGSHLAAKTEGQPLSQIQSPTSTQSRRIPQPQPSTPPRASPKLVISPSRPRAPGESFLHYLDNLDHIESTQSDALAATQTTIVDGPDLSSASRLLDSTTPTNTQPVPPNRQLRSRTRSQSRTSPQFPPTQLNGDAIPFYPSQPSADGHTNMHAHDRSRLPVAMQRTNSGSASSSSSPSVSNMNVNNNELDSSEERRYTAQEKGKGRAVPAATPITISDTDGEMSDEIVLSGDGVANGNENGNDGMGGRVGMKRKALEVVDADDVDGYIRDGDESDGSEVEAIFDDSQYVEETDGGAQGEVGEKGGMGLPQKDDRLGSFTCPVCFSEPRNAVMTSCGHVLCAECLFQSLIAAIVRSPNPYPAQQPVYNRGRGRGRGGAGGRRGRSSTRGGRGGPTPTGGAPGRTGYTALPTEWTTETLRDAWSAHLERDYEKRATEAGLDRESWELVRRLEREGDGTGIETGITNESGDGEVGGQNGLAGEEVKVEQVLKGLWKIEGRYSVVEGECPVCRKALPGGLAPYHTGIGSVTPLAPKIESRVVRVGGAKRHVR